MFHTYDGIVGLVILAIIALKTIEGGGDWFDIFNNSTRYDNARTDADFKLTIFMIVAILLGLVVFAAYKVQVEESAPVYQAETQPVSIAQHKSAQTQHKSVQALHKSAHVVHRSQAHHVVAPEK